MLIFFFKCKFFLKILQNTVLQKIMFLLDKKRMNAYICYVVLVLGKIQSRELNRFKVYQTVFINSSSLRWYLEKIEIAKL